MKCGILWVALVSIAVSSSPGKFSFGLDASPAFITDRSSANWKTGYSIGGDFFANYSFPAKYCAVGFRVAYENWAADRTHLLRSLPVQDLNGNAAGFQSFWEFLPMARLATDFAGSPVNFFVQAGYSWYIRNGYLRAQGTSASDTFSVSFRNGAKNEGPTLGGGVSIKLPHSLSIEILPLCHFVWGSRITEFITSSAGVMISL